MSANSGGAPRPLDPQLAVLGMVQISIVLAVAVLITGQIFDALPAQSGPFGNASQAVVTQTGQAFELAPIVLIVVVASVVIGVVRRI